VAQRDTTEEPLPRRTEPITVDRFTVVVPNLTNAIRASAPPTSIGVIDLPSRGRDQEHCDNNGTARVVPHGGDQLSDEPWAPTGKPRTLPCHVANEMLIQNPRIKKLLAHPQANDLKTVSIQKCARQNKRGASDGNAAL